MTATVLKDKKVTVVTGATDNMRISPTLLCQILKMIFCPPCSSVLKGLLQTNVTTALGTVQIMVGLFSIGLGPGRMGIHAEDFAGTEVVCWLGGVFIAAGIMSIFAGQLPTLVLVGFAMFLNIVGSVFAIISIVLHGRDLAGPSVLSLCDRYGTDAGNDDDACRTVASYAQNMLTAIDITSITLATLQLSVSISFVIMAVKALINRKKEEVDEDDDVLQPEMKDVLVTCPDV
ncbi:uncharacterized protein LOC128367090 isoform X2 [Scomber japonicus]|uniref:uncharacterized protein LOC128367090 isoform X2 n=1 Tax=Scomber japonicus TaxID=13676 RepID=UPI002304E4C4|nr:uncharacterized protein LOC128367090 isoform X2 [Scomber japonicus]